MVWYRRHGRSTVPDVEDDQRVAFRRALGTTLKAVRRKLTPYRSQASIAELLGVDSDTVGRWERGEREPKVSELVLLWERYDVPAEWLLRPTADVNELDGWIAGLQRERQTQAALEVARAEEEEGPTPSDDAASAAQRGRRLE